MYTVAAMLHKFYTAKFEFLSQKFVIILFLNLSLFRLCKYKSCTSCHL